MAVRKVGGGIAVDGLAETIRALGKVDRRLKAEAIDVLRDGAKIVQVQAQGRIGAGGYRLRRNKGMIGRSATSTGAGIKLRGSKYPWAFAAEYGERVAHVYGRPVRVSRFKRRTVAPHKPPTSTDLSKNRGGYMIQPSIRKLLPVLREDAGERITALVTEAMRAEGVKGRG